MSEALYRIVGGHPLHGDVAISGAKNAAMPCLAAAMLTADPCTIHNLPRIRDVTLFLEIMRTLGVRADIAPDGGSVTVYAAGPLGEAPPNHLVANQRASFLVMGPLLAREGRGACAAPGGDVIGQRPLDVHLTGFIRLGAEVSAEGGRFVARARGRLRGSRVVLDYPSVLGTENLLLAAVLAEGRTTIVNAAMEPEVLCLAAMLTRMGARIDGAGAHTITVDGVDRLHGTEHRLIPDRIEAGTFALAAAITGGEVLLQNARPRHMDALLFKLQEMNVEIREEDGGVRVRAARPLAAANIQAVPYPGLATDLQALVVTTLTQANGISVVHERVFENRLQYVGELRKLGAHIVSAGTTAIIQGPTPFRGTVVRGLDIRASAALVLAGLAAEGTTELVDLTHLDRGYECFEEKLRALGAHIERTAIPAGSL